MILANMMYQPQTVNSMTSNYGYPQYNNPYQNYYSQMQSQQSNAMNNQQMFKLVDSLDVVKATDIPIDGNWYYFPKADGSNIYSKRWLPNGTTQILTYKPICESDTSNSMSNSTESVIRANDELTRAFMERFDRIEKLLAPYTEEKESKNE